MDGQPDRYFGQADEPVLIFPIEISLFQDFLLKEREKGNVELSSKKNIQFIFVRFSND